MDFLRSEAVPDFSHRGEESESWLRVWLETLESILLAVVVFVAINTLSERIRVESISMQPNLYEGDFVLVNRLAYEGWLGRPARRGEVVVIENPFDPDEVPYIKRVIGLPGDVIHIANGQVMINGNVLNEPYVSVSTQRGGDWTVPEGALFVMGDNRNNSSDSRAWGFVTMARVIGRAEMVYWPFEHWQILHVSRAAAASP